jgi:hypothetical protein
MKKLDPGLAAILISLLVIGGGFAVGHLTNVIAAKDLYTSFFVIAAFVSGSIYLGSSYILPIIDRHLKNAEDSIILNVNEAISEVGIKINAFEGRMDVFQVFQDPDWVLTTRDLVDRESKLPQKEVWIVSSYLGVELDENLFAPIIRANIKKGVTYYYVIPDDHLARSKVESIARMTNGKGTRAIQINESDFFRLVSTHDTCIFDPFENHKDSCVGYMNIPNAVNDLDYFIKLSPDYSKRLISTVKAKGVEIVLNVEGNGK